MITGTIIGIVYMTVSDRVKVLRPNSTIKMFATGVATNVVIWAVLFVPLHFLLTQPSLQKELSTLPSNSQMYFVAQRLITMSDPILCGALAIHIAFGGVLGFMAGITTSSRFDNAG